MEKELEKYFLGELSDKEKRVLFDKIESDKDYKTEFMRMQNTVSLSQLSYRKEDRQYALQMMEALKTKISLKQKHRTMFNLIKYAAVIVFLIINGWLILEKNTLPEDPISYTTIEVPKGQRVFMTLPDGTQTWLSPHSVLRISNKYNREERLVELDGEGYFSVTKDKEKPFIVTTGQHKVKVLGTRFNVFAYSKSKRFETDLLEGKVEVFDTNNTEQIVVLNPGEKVSLENNHLVKSNSQFNNEEYLKSGIFTFKNKPFGEILEYMTLWYDVEFEVHDSAKKKRLISGKFRQSDEVKDILKALQGVHPFGYKEINEQKIEIN